MHTLANGLRARFDADYYRIIGLRTDLNIILSTVRVVFRGTGV